MTTSRRLLIAGLSYAACALAGCAQGTATHATLPSESTLASAQSQAVSGAAPLVAARPVTFASTSRRATGRSWMDAGAKKGNLLYISDYTPSVVDVYSYPGGAQVGMLTGFDLPQGLCSDASGNVWVTNTGKSQLIEYAHGGTTPIATLSDPGYYPVGCSVNPKTGDLAVSNIEQTAHGLQGDVAIYPHAQGLSIAYGPPGFYTVYFVGYDNKGNLFADGTDAEAGANGAFQYGELPRHATSMINITLTGATIAFPGNVQWDGHEMTVGDQDNAVVYQIAGTAITGHTPLNGSGDVVDYTIDGKTLIGPDATNADVGFYSYPAGGSATKSITGFTEPIGSTVSK